jgi:hypothetical protein
MPGDFEQGIREYENLRQQISAFHSLDDLNLEIKTEEE